MTKENIVNGRDLLERLAGPFLPQDIEWRVQSASQNSQGQTKVLVVPYIESRAVMNRLDQVCGANWQSHFDKIIVNNKEAFQCRLSIKIGEEWITRTDAAEVSDFESVKGGHSNALKRAGTQWGIGRYLYDCPKFWVPLLQNGEHRVNGKFKIKGQDVFLSGYFNTPVLPDWAVPDGYQPKSSAKMENGKQQNHEQQIEALKHMKGLLQFLNVPQNYVQGLLKRSSGYEGELNQASYEVLHKLYKVVNPVYVYVCECEKLGLTMDELLNYAQITLKVGLQNIHQMYFKMDEEIAKNTLDLVKGDRQLAS